MKANSIFLPVYIIPSPLYIKVNKADEYINLNILKPYGYSYICHIK